MRLAPLYIIVAINLLVYIGWSLVATEAQVIFLIENFLVSWDGVMAGRYWTLLTSVFSHATLFHLLFNMMALMSFSTVMIAIMGPLNYTFFYLVAGLSGSMAHIMTSAFLMHDPQMNALGASGAVAGIILLFSLLFPQQKLLIMGIIPIRAIWGAIFLMGLDIWGLITQTRGGGLPIGHGAHLGGAMVGIIFFLVLRMRRPKI